MANVNIAVDFGSIHSYSSQTSSYPASNVIDGSTNCANSWSTTSAYTEWVIIDLGQSFSISGFKIFGYSCDYDAFQSVRKYRVGLSNSPTGFTTVVSSTCPRSDVFGGFGTIGQQEVLITPTSARYVKLYLDNNWYSSEPHIFCSEFYIYSPEIQTETETITSDAEIYHPTTTITIPSDAYIYIKTETDTRTIKSNAVITNGDSITSNAYIAGSSITSNAHITGQELETIKSNAYIYQSGSFVRDIFIAGSGTEVSGSRGTLVYTTDISTSDETIVVDMITGTVMDLDTISPPLGYQNYDWAYDWVVRNYNQCQYKFEARSGDTLQEVNGAVFHEITQGQLVPRGSAKRYHQWRAHVWASGSGDFELHQFTIKAYVNYPQDPLYRTLRDKEFYTASKVTLNTQLVPGLTGNEEIYTGDVIPGDLNGDGVVDSSDLTALLAYVYFNTTPANPKAADVNGDGKVDLLDITYLINYLNGTGPAPVLKKEIT